MKHLLAIALLAATSAQATDLYVLSASAVRPNSLIQSFSVTFDDLNGNGLFSRSEMISSNIPPVTAGSLAVHHSGPFSVPVIEGLTEPPHLSEEYWVFIESTVPYQGSGPGSWSVAYLPTEFTYTLTLVPEPSAWLLFAAGAGFLSVVVRRRS